MHMIALNIHPSRSSELAYLCFFQSLQHVLPCGVCRKEYCKMVTSRTHLRLRPELFRSRETAFAWTVALHRAVSSRLKKRRDMDVRIDWRARYESFRHRHPPVKPLPPGQGITRLLYTPRTITDSARVRATVSRFFRGTVRLQCVDRLPPGTFLVDATRPIATLDEVLHVLHRKYKT